MSHRRRSPRLLLALTAIGATLATAPAASASGTVTVSVAGQGSVTATGINCTQSGGPDCSEAYPDVETCEFDPEIREWICFSEPQTVDFTAAAGTNGYTFSGWTGCDAVSGQTCTYTVTQDKTLTATYNDTAPPSVTGLSPASGVQRGTINLSAAASDNSGAVNRVEFRVRNVLVGTDTTAPYGISFNTASVADGFATLRATAFDAAGLSGFTETAITIDNTAPTLSVTGGPNGQTFGPGSTQTWTFSATDPASGLQSVQCSVVPTGSAPSFGTCSGGATSHSVSNRPDGNYTFSVRARDNGGLETTVSRTFAIDATPPETTIESGPADGSSSTDRSATFGFSSSEGGSTFRCRVYPAGITPPDFAACSGDGTHTASDLNPGTYTFEVQAVDAFGNADATAAARTFTVATASGTGTGSGSGGSTGSSPPPAGPGGTPVTNAAALLTSGPTVARARLRRALARGLAVAFACSRGCVVTAQLRAARGLLAATTLVAQGNKSLLAAGTGKVVLKFTRKAKRALGSKRSVRLTLVFSVKDAAGAVTRVTRRVTLRR